MSLAKNIKDKIFPAGSKPRTLIGGPYRGLKMNIDFHLQMQIYLGIYEKELHRGFVKLSRGIKTAIDAGTEFGEYSLYFLAKTDAEKVYGFDPAPGVKEKYLANMQLNGFNDDRRSVFSNSFLGAVTMGRYVALNSMEKEIKLPCLAKVDVEGAELDVLKGADQLIKKPGMRWLIETHSESLEKDCVEYLTKAGYRTKIISQAWWRVILPEGRLLPHNRWLLAANDMKL